MKSRFCFALLPLISFHCCLLTFTGCVRLDTLPGQTGSTITSANTFPGVDPGGTSLTTLHFTLQGYTEGQLRPVATLVEDLYNKIGSDTGLYSFMASGSYTLVLYKDQDEYFAKTHQPAWSRAVTAGNAVYAYPGQDLAPVLMHELTHLIFNSFMGDKVQTLRWINEGLAVHEELSQMSEGDRSTYLSRRQSQLHQQRLPFSQMTFFVPASEEQHLVDVWYEQVESVVGFMLDQASRLNFASMLNTLRSGGDIDRAIQENYPGRFGSLNDVEVAWRGTV